MEQKRNPTTSVVAWIALVIAIAAFILGWFAYNHASNPNLQEQIKQDVQNAIQNADQHIPEGVNVNVQTQPQTQTPTNTNMATP